MTSVKSILLIDDDLEDQEIFEEVLKEIDEPFICACVKTGEEAIASLTDGENKRPDFIFLDLNLPFMSGMECLGAIKQNEQLQNIPVIVYSTSSRHLDIQKAKELGAVEYITKPSTFGELKNMLQSVLKVSLIFALHSSL